ncbi:MAG: FKBP-type peptidyl-prolyl cis-trans isomerase [Pseudomonadota bacterium]|jgi:FKBP-type peptidyl-prolyl cis-trans isomerase FklB
MMKSTCLLPLLIALALGTTVYADETAAPRDPKQGSYQVGLLLGSQLEHSGAAKEIVVTELIRGLKEALAGKEVSTGDRDAAQTYLKGTREALANENRVSARNFLAANAKQAGVVQLPSGLQYRILTEGDAQGAPPLPADQVTVRYTASLIDGTVYDRSETHDKPSTFKVNSVFKAWQEAFRMMKPGAKWQLFVPPDLGYGNNTPPMVPPGSAIIYEIELLKIEPPVPMPKSEQPLAVPAGSSTPVPTTPSK